MYTKKKNSTTASEMTTVGGYPYQQAEVSTVYVSPASFWTFPTTFHQTGNGSGRWGGVN
jgi:hypothetical protein